MDLLTVYMLTGYGHRPQHVLGTLGLTCFGISGVSTLILIVRRLIDQFADGQIDFHLHESPMLYLALTGVIVGIQLLMTGFVAELVTKQTSKDEQIYAIQASTGLDKNDT